MPQRERILTGPHVEHVGVTAYTLPTDYPEADGTIGWASTTIVVVEVRAGGMTGIGYAYGDAAAAHLIYHKLAKLVEGLDAMDVASAWGAMTHAVRNIGRPGVAMTAISAIDVALWDLKAKLLNLPLVKLLGGFRPAVAVYGSGGFTSYPIERLQEQLAHWAEAGIEMVKMKVGTDPGADVMRVTAAREAIGPATDLFVDANGAYARKQALDFAEAFMEAGVSWFEEPVSSDDLEGLRLLRDRAPAGMSIAAGEYGWDGVYFRRMLEAQAVDVLQADATRCGGLTGFMRVGALCDAFMIPLSAHTAPTIHMHAGCALPAVVHLEYFHDHVRIEQMLFEGAPTPIGGHLRPDLARAGLGVEFKRSDAARYAV